MNDQELLATVPKLRDIQMRQALKRKRLRELMRLMGVDQHSSLHRDPYELTQADLNWLRRSADCFTNDPAILEEVASILEDL